MTDADAAALTATATTLAQSLLDGDAELAGDLYSTSELAAALAARASKAWQHLAEHGEAVPASQYPLLCAAAVSRRGNHVGAQQRTSYTVDRFRVYRRFADLPVWLLLRTDVTSDAGDEALAADVELLGETWRATREARVAVPPMFVTMVAASVLRRLGAGAKVGEVLDRGLELAAQYRRELPLTGAAEQLPVVGNTDVVVQVVAFRVAVDEFAGTASPDTAELVEQVWALLRRAMSRPLGRTYWRAADEPDAVLAFHAFARFIGADDRTVARVFRQLHPELDGLTLRATRREVAVEWQADTPVPPDEILEDASHVAGWLSAALCPRGSAAEREAVLAWVRGERAVDSQDHLPALVIAVRRADTTLRALPSRPPPAVPAGDVLAAVLLPKVESALRLGDRGTEILTHVLPPLWTRRAPAVKLTERRLGLGSRHQDKAHASLVAATVVRAPAQRVECATAKERPTVCACGARARGSRTRQVVPSPVHICPHRPWDEPGNVENYTTLTEAAGYASPEATRRQLRRYRGPWQEWIEDALAE